ncbi:MAG: hypothetical protein M1817_006040 [Caeruleum heppii]|nr:MAG: hypothetical protein M1817_006040 [Caeruleum heppii]
MATPNPPSSSAATNNPQNPHVIYTHIHEIAAKRIATLDYLRKVHEGPLYWFNTLHFTRTSLGKLPTYASPKLSRRATNYLLLGLSLPTLLELTSQNPLEFLRTFNALLLEFESYQQIHPPDGSASSSLSRARIPAMFKRAATHATSSKGRRTSSATEIGHPIASSTSDPSDLKSMIGVVSNDPNSTGGAGNASMSFPNQPPPLPHQPSSSSLPSSSDDLLPGEEYTHLLTPSLPFDPDFYETFATLCDTLIDCYTRVTGLIGSPALCAQFPGVGDMFNKMDARVRKVVVSGAVRDLEEATRGGVKTEMAGVGKVVLGGLM